jgi:hypothetical protein
MLLFFAAVTHIVCSMLALLLGNLKLRCVACCGCSMCLLLAVVVASTAEWAGSTPSNRAACGIMQDRLFWLCCFVPVFDTTSSSTPP